MLLVRVKETGSIAEVEPRFNCGRYTGFRVVDSNTVYSYSDVDILSAAEIEAIKTLSESSIDDDYNHCIKKLLEKIKSADDNSCNFESLGAHIRNILSPYANIIQLLKEVRSEKDEQHIEKIKKFLFNNIDPKELDKNLQHFIAVSHLDEVERINWKATKLSEEYYSSNEINYASM